MVLNNKQIEELGRFFLDISKLVFGSLVLGLFSSDMSVEAVFGFEFVGLIFSAVFCILGIKLLGKVKKK